MVQTKLFKDGVHIAVEVGYQHHGVLCRKPFQDGFGDGGDMLYHLVVAGIKDGILRGYSNAVLLQILCLQGYLGLQGLAEGIIGADNGVAAKGSLVVDVSMSGQRLGGIGRELVVLLFCVILVDVVFV